MRTCVCYLEIQRSLRKEGNARFANEGHLQFDSSHNLLNRAAVGWAVSCSAFGFFIYFFLSVTISKPPRMMFRG